MSGLKLHEWIVMHGFRWLATITLTLVLTPSAVVQASPAEARRAAVSLMSAITSPECEFPEEVHWPLHVDGDRVDRTDRLDLCPLWRPRMLVARIENVYSEEFASGHFHRLELAGTQVFLVDLGMPAALDGEPGNGASLVFDCTDSGCTLISMMSTPLHRHSDRTRVFDPEQEQILLAARLASAVGSISPIRTYLLEYRFSMGHWPERLEQAGLDPARLYSPEIDGVELGANGTIRVRLSQVFGAGKFLELTPQEEMSGSSVRWRCRSNLPYPVLSELRGLSCRMMPGSD